MTVAWVRAGLSVGLAAVLAGSPALAATSFHIGQPTAVAEPTAVPTAPVPDPTPTAPAPPAVPTHDATRPMLVQPAVTVYRSMAEASKAGVNPRAKPVEAPITEAKPVAAAGLWRWVVPGIGGVLVVLVIGWAGRRSRQQAGS